MQTYKRLRRLWEPSADKLDSLGAVVRGHWRAALAHPERLFWGSTVSWVRVQVVRTYAQRAPAHHHFTTGGRLIR